MQNAFLQEVLFLRRFSPREAGILAHNRDQHQPVSHVFVISLVGVNGRVGFRFAG
jgi:hypothetical protein